jgi:NADPH:quinone reductase-like Zn-dependent oxidoreductase
MAETVLVTGGTGFIGRWCIAELLARGYEVRTTVRSLDKEASVRAAVATTVAPGDRLVCVVADLTHTHTTLDGTTRSSGATTSCTSPPRSAIPLTRTTSSFRLATALCAFCALPPLLAWVGWC